MGDQADLSDRLIKVRLHGLFTFSEQINLGFETSSLKILKIPMRIEFAQQKYFYNRRFLIDLNSFLSYPIRFSVQ